MMMMVVGWGCSIWTDFECLVVRLMSWGFYAKWGMDAECVYFQFVGVSE